MERKVYITVSLPIIVRVDDGVEVAAVMDKLKLEATLSKRMKSAELEDVGPFDWEVTDSK